MFVLGQVRTVLCENHQISVKKSKNHMSSIMCSEFGRRAHFFKSWKVASFVGLEKLYRTGVNIGQNVCNWIFVFDLLKAKYDFKWIVL
jgi:hypothetical protein